MAVYNSSVEWDRTSACKVATGSRYQSIFWSHLPTHPPNPHMNVKDMKSEIEINHPTGDYIPYSLSPTSGAYSLSSLSEKTRKSNRLQMSLQRAALSPQLFKDPDCWSGRD